MIRTVPKATKRGVSSGVTVRETTGVQDRRPVVVVLGPFSAIGFRLKGTRRIEKTSVEACYALAVRQRVASEKAEKRKARKT